MDLPPDHGTWSQQLIQLLKTDRVRCEQYSSCRWLPTRAWRCLVRIGHWDTSDTDQAQGFKIGGFGIAARSHPGATCGTGGPSPAQPNALCCASKQVRRPAKLCYAIEQARRPPRLWAWGPILSHVQHMRSGVTPRLLSGTAIYSTHHGMILDFEVLDLLQNFWRCHSDQLMSLR